MLDYDFHILQPNEFERLVRDLLQKKEKIFINGDILVIQIECLMELLSENL